MTSPQNEATTEALHEELFETQIRLQTRLLDYIEQSDAFDMLDEAWEEFTNYEPREMDPEDPEPVLHFFPWALFYWRRDVPQEALDEAREQLLGDDVGDQNLDPIDELDEETIEEVLSQTLDDGSDELFEEDDDDDDVDYVALPPIAVMFMNSVDGADGPDSPAAGQVLTASEREFIEAASQAPFSFFKVTAVGPGAFVTLEDLIVPSEVKVYAPALVDMSEEDDILYGQVVSKSGAHLLSAVGPAVLPGILEASLDEAREQLEGLVPDLGDDWRYELEFEMRGLYHQMVQGLQDALDDNEPDGDGIEPISPTRH